jgi:hypothetical protein
MPATGPIVEISCATMNTYPYDLPGRPDWASSVEDFIPLLEQTGCANVEVLPSWPIVDDIRRGLDPEVVAQVIGSTHQAFFEGRDGLINKIAARRGLAGIHESLAGIAIIQSVLPEQRPAIVFGDKAPEDGFDLQNTGAELRVAQPAAEVYRDLGVKYPDLPIMTNAGLFTALSRDGIIGVCGDIAHSRRYAADNSPVPPIENVWGDMFASGRMYEMHVALNRRDMAKRDPLLAKRSAAEFIAFCSGRWQLAQRTEAGQMVIEAIQRWVQPADLPRPALRAVLEVPPLPKEYRGWIRKLGRCVDSLAGLVQHAGGTPLTWGQDLQSVLAQRGSPKGV